MSHFAEIDNNGIVIRVIVAEQDFIDSGAVGNPSNWIQTSYNTFGGKNERTGIPIRKNYAVKGFKYDKQRDAFIPPKPYESWKLNEETCLWEPPIPQPELDPNNVFKYWTWNESELIWEENYLQ
jgi:hypothetical protein